MKLFVVFCLMLFFVLEAIPQQYNSNNFSTLKAQYLGQEPPEMMPELFAPGIISTSPDEVYPSFTRDDMEFYFKCSSKGGWLFTFGSGKKWSNPQNIPFSNEYTFGEAMVTADGKTILFCTKYDYGEPISSQNLDLW